MTFHSWDDISNNLLRVSPMSQHGKRYFEMIIEIRIMSAQLFVRGATGSEYWNRHDALCDRIKQRAGQVLFPESWSTRISSTYGKKRMN